MPRTIGEPISRVHAWVYDSDLEKLRSIYSSNIGVSQAIREIIRKFLEQTSPEKELLY